MVRIDRRGRAVVWMFALALFVASGAGVVVGFAGPASAHATLESSSPTDQQRFAAGSPPQQVSIEFSEAVSSDGGGNSGLRVLDSKGDRVDNGDGSQPSSSSLRITLKPDLPDGSYVANYQVISADGHPVQGGIIFVVGTGDARDVSAVTSKVAPVYDVLGKLGQFLVYVGTFAAAGLAFFLAVLVVAPTGGATAAISAARARCASIARWACAVAAIGVVVVLVAQCAQVAGTGFGAIFDGATLGAVLRQGLVWADAALLVGLAACVVSLHVRTQAARQAFAVGGGLTATASFALWGHAKEMTLTWVAIPSDVAHGVAGAVWFGGLIGLASVLRARLRDDHSDVSSLQSTVAVVQRFSAAAAFSILAVTVAGIGLAVATVGSFGQLLSTAYGVTLLVKLAVVGIIFFIAAYNRFFLLPWLMASGTDDVDPAAVENQAVESEAVESEVVAGWRTLLRTVIGEGLGIVAVLGVTAVLVVTPPAIDVSPAPEPGGPFQATQPFRAGKVSLTITPNEVGANSFHVDLSGADGRPADLAKKMTLELRLPEKDIGPLTREMNKAAKGHFILEDINDLSITGTWQVTLVARVTDFDEQRVDFQDPVR